MGDECLKLLLDTHVRIWCHESPERLGAEAAAAIEDDDSELFVSPVSSLEVARLVWGKRLSVTGPARTWVEETLSALLERTLPLSHDVAVEAYELPDNFHRDPADCLLVASARLHDLTPITADRRILRYSHVRSLDATR